MRYQASTELLIKKRPSVTPGLSLSGPPPRVWSWLTLCAFGFRFERLVQEISVGNNLGLQWEEPAVLALQEAAEAYIVKCVPLLPLDQLGSDPSL